MRDFLFECIYYVSELFKYMLIYRMAFEFELRKKWYVLVGNLFIVILFGVYYAWFENNEIVSMCVYATLVGLFSLFTFRKVGEWYRGVAVCVWSYATITMIDGISYMLVCMSRIDYLYINRLITNILTFLILLLIFGITRRKNPHAMKNISPGYYVAFTVIGIANMMVLSLWFEYEIKYTHINWIFIIILLGVILQMLMVLMLAVSRNLWKEKEALNSYYLSIQEQHYHYLENREKETKSFRHDMRSHLYILDQLLEEGNAKEAKKYLQKMFAVVDAPHHHANIGNPIVDAILTQYLSICEQRKIQFEIKGHMPVTCELPAFDLCTIFSNLLQNAVEAVEACAKKMIFLQFRYDDDNIYIYLENTYTDLQYDNGDLVSTKGDDHGYGMNNIKRGVEHCGGMIEYEALEDKFMAFLEFPQTIRAKK